MTLPLRACFVAAWLLQPLASARAADPAPGDNPKAVDFFESKIRPALIEHCQKCHSDEAETNKKLRGGLKLDSKPAWQKGGDSGPVIVAGKPAESSLIASLKYDGDLKMPPKGKLPASVIADFEKWVRDGAVDPRSKDPAAKAAGIDIEKGRTFWAFQPPKLTTIPESSGLKSANPIDAFIGAKLAEKGLTPVGPADKRALVRRVYFDLLGLPPTPEEVEAFVSDSSPDAFAKLVDRLLASSHYGERWARHWLDVARYAEDQAHTFQVKPKKNAYLYRDWVIKAFNSDMPYDNFVKLQIAGDLLPESSGDRFTRLAGLGFMGLGAEYYKNSAAEQAAADELDDRVDTLTRGFLGLTVSCARCHDHKFDPIPTRDYYSLAGIFSGSKLTEAPLASPAEVARHSAAQTKIKEAEDKVNLSLAEAGRSAVRTALPQTAKYLAAAWKIRASKKGKATADEIAKAEGLNRYFLDRWVKFIESGATKAPPAFKEWFALKPTSTEEEVAAAAETVQTKLAGLVPPLPAITPAKGNKKAGAAKDADSLTKVMFLDPAAPLLVPAADAERLFMSSEEKTKLVEMRAEVETHKKAAPPAPLTAHVLSGGGAGMKVFIRGNPATKGEDAPMRFLQVISTASEKPAKTFTRLELANAIASPDNPLTARVFVNRIWQEHFGRGLVNTPSNFGSLGGRPSHPELLDWLAVNFVKNGWSVKWLQKQILTSAVYQMASQGDEANEKIDGGNVYLWHANRRRLDVEGWRDSLLAISGNLDPAEGGPTFDLRDASARRRTVYAKISRHEPDGLLRLFDFPDANVTADHRSVTTVPQQQLFALNSEFMVLQAKAFAARVAKVGSDDEQRVKAAYQLAFSREPETQELAIAMAFLKAPTKPTDKLTRWQRYAQALLASNELMYVD